MDSGNLYRFFLDRSIQNMRFKTLINTKQSGFTLVELMVSVAIVVLMATISIPAVTNSIPKFRYRSECRKLVTMFNHARFEAVRRNVDVGITFTLPNQYVVFVDDGAGAGTASNAVQDGAELTLVAGTITAQGVSLQPSGGVAWNNTGYNSKGTPLGNRVGSIDIQGTMRDGTISTATLSLSFSGHVRLLDVDKGINF